MEAIKCKHYGNFNRDSEICLSCGSLDVCQQQKLPCYARFDVRKTACRNCRFRDYCRAAGKEPEFHARRHGEPPIVLMEAEGWQVENDPSPAVSPGEVFSDLFRDCNYNPRTVAIVIARHGGMSYAQIGRYLQMSKQLVAWHIDRLPNRALADYLRRKKTSRHFHSPLKDAAEADQPAAQLTLDLKP